MRTDPGSDVMLCLLQEIFRKIKDCAPEPDAQRGLGQFLQRNQGTLVTMAHIVDAFLKSNPVDSVTMGAAFLLYVGT
jgi:hypothetical protein